MPPQMPGMMNPMFSMGMMGNVQPPRPAPAPPKEEQPQNKTMAPDPDIVDLFDYFHIDPRHLSRFEGLMAKREATFAGDMFKLWELLEQARSPEGMLVSKMREMETGSFIGKTVPDEELMAVVKKFRLDEAAEAKLSDVLAKYDPTKRREYMGELGKHLEVSGKPSATVMMLLKKLGQGLPLGKPGQPAPGSYADRNRRERDDRRRSKDDGYRPKSPGGRDRYRGRDRGRGRGRDASHDRSHSRSRSGSRSRSREISRSMSGSRSD